jgi:hypothetical protein
MFLSLCIGPGEVFSYMYRWSGVRVYIATKEYECVEVCNICS